MSISGRGFACFIGVYRGECWRGHFFILDDIRIACLDQNLTHVTRPTLSLRPSPLSGRGTFKQPTLFQILSLKGSKTKDRCFCVGENRKLNLKGLDLMIASALINSTYRKRQLLLGAAW